MYGLFHISSKFYFFIGVDMVMCHALICAKEIQQSWKCPRTPSFWWPYTTLPLSYIRHGHTPWWRTTDGDPTTTGSF